MAKVILGNHSSVIVPRQDRDSIRKFYCDVLGGQVTKAGRKEISFALEKTSTSRFSMGMFLMRVSSYGQPDRPGWKSSPPNWRKPARRFSNPVSSGSLICRILTFTFRLQEVRCYGWSVSTRTSHSMREPEKARTWQR